MKCDASNLYIYIYCCVTYNCLKETNQTKFLCRYVISLGFILFSFEIHCGGEKRASVVVYIFIFCFVFAYLLIIKERKIKNSVSERVNKVTLNAI